MNKNQNTHPLIIQLIIAYTLVGAFVFTVIITCLSLIDIIKFADKEQQNKLFYTLIVELMILCVFYFGKILNFNPNAINNTSFSKENILSKPTPEKAIENIRKNSVNGTSNINKYDVEAIVNSSKLIEAVAIFKNYECSDVKRRQFAVLLINYKNFAEALIVCKYIKNTSEIKNTALAALNFIDSDKAETSDEWIFMFEVFNLLINDEKRLIVFDQMIQKNISPKGIWSMWFDSYQKCS